MPTVVSVPSSILTPPAPPSTDQRNSSGTSGQFAGILNADSTSTLGSSPDGNSSSAASSSLPPTAPSSTATSTPSTQQLLGQVQSLMQAGVSVQAIVSSIAQAIVDYVQNNLAAPQNTFATDNTEQNSGASSSSSLSDSQVNEAISQLIEQLTQQNNHTSSLPLPSGSVDPVQALVDALTQDQNSQNLTSKPDEQSVGKLIDRLATMLQQLPSLLAQMSQVGNSSESEVFVKHPVQNEHLSGSNDQKANNPAKAADPELRNISLEMYAQAAQMNGLPQTSTGSPSQAPTAAGSSDAGVTADTTSGTNSAQVLAQISQHIAQLALGLTADSLPTTSNSPSAAPQNSNAGNDYLVKSLGASVSTVSTSDLLLRSLERATNAAILRGENVNPAQSGTNDIFGAIQSALRELAPLSVGTTGPVGKESSGDTSAVAQNAAATTIPSVTATNVGFGATQQQGDFSAAKTGAPDAPDTLHNIINQIVTGISIRDIGSTPTVRIALNPPQLGEVVVHLSVGADQNVSASITANTAEARSTILANIPELTRSLQNSGLKLSYLGVDLSNHGMGYEQKPQEQQAKNRGTRSFGIDTSPEIPGQDQAAGPSLLNSVNLQLLNHLV